jgi:hypothetical protein
MPAASRSARAPRPAGADAGLVRTSRDGDQFHYLRGARLALEMIAPGAALVKIGIEGVSGKDDIREGLNVIDLSLYRGSDDPAAADRVRYRQFKHSTRHGDKAWTASGLVTTLTGFAERYRSLVSVHGAADVARRFRFEFESNRPVAKEAAGALADLAAAVESRRSKYLRAKLPLAGDALAAFAGLVDILEPAPGFLIQRDLLAQDLRAYLPDLDVDAPVKLKDLVARKATSEFETDPLITRHDVLTAIGVSEGELFPADCLIEVPDHIVPRDQGAEIEAAIAEASAPLIIEADGGVGKSVFAVYLARRSAVRGSAFLFDCFGNGGYRSASHYRHRPREGLVQLANEMAADGLCDPLVPTSKSDASDYVRAFMARVRQAATQLQASGRDRLTIVIDAADNAQIAADEISDGPSFPRLLLRETWPANVRLVLTARPHRVDLLDPPSAIKRLTLNPFAFAETAQHLRGRFADARDEEVREFDRRTSHNPRVQSKAMAAGDSVDAVLDALGPSPLSVDDMIAALLETAVAKVQDGASRTERDKIDLICAALATLRPFVPLSVLAATSGVSPAIVRSLVLDLERPLLVRDDAVQFRDEPTETWFRERFRPSQSQLGGFLDRLRPLAKTSGYAAATIPQLMLEAGLLGELIDLALAGAELPEEDMLTRRDIELQRLRFALKAALLEKRFAAAAKLAIKAGSDIAADERQNALLSANTDLAARFLPADQLQEIIARRLVEGGHWTGSHHVYEAAMLSGKAPLAGDARAQLRYAYDWLGQWLRRARTDDDFDERIEDSDIAEFALAELNLHGPIACANELSTWRSPPLPFRVGRRLISRLVDAGRFDEIDSLALAADRSLGLRLAATLELSEVGRTPPREAVRRAFRLSASRHVRLKRPSGDALGREEVIVTVAALAAAAATRRAAPRPAIAKLLDRYLKDDPPRSLSVSSGYNLPRAFAYLRAYTLRAALRCKTITFVDLAHSELRKKLETKHGHGDAERFKEDFGALLPWHRLLAECELGRVTAATIGPEVASALAAMRSVRQNFYREYDLVPGEVARVWAAALICVQAGSADWSILDGWIASQKQPLSYRAQADIARRCGAAGLVARALTAAQAAFDAACDTKEDAETQVQKMVDVSRCVLAASESEARAYFERAILVAERIGEENLHRWQTLTNFAVRAGSASMDDPELAYRFARAGETTYSYLARDKYFDWTESIDALVGLSPRSAFAIASRWTDRRFGREERSLPIFLAALEARGLDPGLVLSLLPMRADWDETPVAERAFDRCAGTEERERLTRHYARYAPFLDSGGPGAWRRRQALLARGGLDPDLVALGLADAEAEGEAERRREWSPSPRRRRRIRPIDWDRVFAGLDPVVPSDLEAAMERYRAAGQGYYGEQLFAAAFTRVSPGCEAMFLESLIERPALSFYELGGLLDVMPETWRSRLTVTAALHKLVRNSYRSHCHSVAVHEYYQELPLSRSAALSGVSRETLVGDAVEAFGELELPAGSSRLFQLGGLTSLLISPAEAEDVLRYGLGLFEAHAAAGDGDGPWREELAPLATLEEGLAGYLWSALGAPEAGRRWCAAHCVRWLVAIDARPALDALVALAGGGSGVPYSDGALTFYHRHALLWLLIGLARAAAESGPTILRHVEFLAPLARRSNPHIVMRHFAAAALLALAGQRLLKLSTDELSALERACRTERQSRPASEATLPPGDGWDDWGSAGSGFDFDFDFSKGFFTPFGRLFGMKRSEMQDAAAKIIADEWGLTEKGDWSEDERALRRFFRGDTSRRTGAIEPICTLTDQLSWHAGMTLVGTLLETSDLFEENDGWGSLADRLAHHLLVRTDGLWQFDTRARAPTGLTGLDGSPETWRDALTPTLADREMRAPDGRMFVSGHWTASSFDRKLRVAIDSALVDRERGAALARSLRCAADPMDYRLPNIGDGHEIDEGGYQLEGWLAHEGSHSGLDEHDPWGARLSTGETLPPVSTIAALGLAKAPGGQSWFDGDGSVGLALEKWSNGANEDADRHNWGRRLSASPAVLRRLLDMSGKDLVVEVRVTRELTRVGRKSGETKDAKTITRIQIFGSGRGARRFRPGP